MHFIKYSKDLDILIIDTKTAFRESIKSSTPLAIYVIDEPSPNDVINVLNSCTPENSFKAPAGLERGELLNSRTEGLKPGTIDELYDKGYNPVKCVHGKYLIWAQNVIGIEHIVNGRQEQRIGHIQNLFLYNWIRNINNRKEFKKLKDMVYKNDIQFSLGNKYYKPYFMRNLNYYETPIEFLKYINKSGLDRVL